MVATAVVGTITAVMVRQTGRARAEADLWAEATEPAKKR